MYVFYQHQHTYLMLIKYLSYTPSVKVYFFALREANLSTVSILNGIKKNF